MIQTKIRLGDMLVQNGLITVGQLNEALQKQRQSGRRLGNILIEDGYISREQLTKVLETQLGIKSINLKYLKVDPKVARLIPENLARRHKVIPFEVNQGRLCLAMWDPLDPIAIQDVGLMVKMPVQPFLSYADDIEKQINIVFSQAKAAQAIGDYMQSQSELLGNIDNVNLDINAAPIVRFVQSTIENAVRSGASDIHIEPYEAEMRVRVRVDGILQKTLVTGLKAHGAIVSRIKVMANLNISEKRLPQDGRMMIEVDNREIDLRISTMPTNHGEKIVMRILDRGSFLIGMEKLGLNPMQLEVFERLLARPYGIILVTGPTGSGKTTTLYAMLSKINDHQKNIITLEDPIELDMKGINQTAVNAKAGLLFSTGLRSILRQDPDVIMVGEIRDSETIEISMRAALTGHLVLSTLHTNDAPGAVTRIMDMGIEPYMISSSLVGIVGQRLVRKICPKCGQSYEADEREKRILKMPLDETLMLRKGSGCEYCNQTGYKGRIGIYEIMEVSSEQRQLIDDRASLDQLRAQVLEQGMMTLQEDARHKVLQGITTVEEMLRVTYTT